MTPMTTIVEELATYTTESNYQVLDTTDAEGTPQVEIIDIAADEPSYTLRYEDYDAFMATANGYVSETGCDIETALAAAAKPYVENLA